MTDVFCADAVVSFHEQCHSIPQWPASVSPRHETGLWEVIELNHRFNCLLWNEEDLARRRQVEDADIAGNKRAIDGYNQRRNDAIERLDEILLGTFASVERRTGAKLSSETAGSMVDRLSILSLKIHHMSLQTTRTDVEPTHIDTCKARVLRFLEQRQDLAGCLDRLMMESAKGDAWFKIYRQFKMYNDPKLNPAVYGEKA